MTISSEMTKASRKRKPLFISSSSRKASSAVISAPPIRGMPNSNLSAIAVPMTSARSQAMIAASQASQSMKLTGREKLARQACARSRSVTMPSRAASACNRIAIRFDSRMTDSSV